MNKLVVSIHDVAKRADVSIGTVSRVLNDSPRVTPLTRQTVKQAIIELNYRPNPSARALRSHRTGLIALTVPELTNPYFAGIAEGIQHVLATANFQLVLCRTDSEAAAERDYLAMLSNRQVDGLIAVSRQFALKSEGQRALLQLGQQGYPIVVLGQSPKLILQYFDAITTDTSSGMRDAISHLLKENHTEIAYFGAPSGIATVRLETYLAALTDHGLAIKESLIFRMEPVLESGYKTAVKLLKERRRPTAIVAVNDVVAIGAMMALQQHGVSIPKEMSVVGFDDIPLASIIEPKLTTVFQPKSELGRLAAERLLGRLDQTITKFRSISLSSHLIVRNSTASVPGNSILPRS